ncbi:MAG: hypothetical protein U0V74_16550 [Chitinophagales bacterium]
MKYLSVLLLFITSFCAAQKEDVFRIEKAPAEKQYQKVYKLDLFTGVDTLEVSSGRLFDFTNAKGTYDSISVFNMSYKLMGKYIMLKPGKFEGIGIFKLFKKSAEGVMQLFFIKNFRLIKPKRDY